MTDETFKDAPESIAELRSTKERDGSLWMPRDALVSLLRDIDSGKVAPDHILIAYSAERNGRPNSYYIVAGQNPLICYGVALRAIWSVMNDAAKRGVEP